MGNEKGELGSKLLIERCLHCKECTRQCDFLKKYGMDIGDSKRMGELSYHCFLCGKCADVCPVGIDGRAEFLDIRRKQVADNKGRVAEEGFEMLVKEKQNYIFRNYKNATKGSVLFAGCNFPSFYPKTTKSLADLLRNEAGIGTVYDCCGKPIAELGLKDQEEKIIERMSARLEKSGIEEVIMLCPNCYYFLRDKLEVKVSGIYEVLTRLGMGNKIEGSIDVFLPCPDKKERRWISQIERYVSGGVRAIDDIQCCGLGGCARGKEPEISRGFTERLKERGYPKIYTYCASCAGKFARDGMQGIHHVLSDILRVYEEPDTAKSMINRAKSKFW